jgi:hypothetical protein
MPDPFARFVSDSLDAIVRDAPGCGAALAVALDAVVLDLVVDDERAVVYRDGHVRAVAAPVAQTSPAIPGRPIVHVATTARTVLDLASGRDELLPAILANRIRVRAAMHDAERLFDVLRLFVEGNARSSAAPALFAEYHRQVTHESRRST